jgi:hypothetical protein
MSGHRYNSGAEDSRHSVTAVFGIHQENAPQALHAPVLVLNASYEPINICAARRAIVLVLKGVAMAEEENGHFLLRDRNTCQYCGELLSSSELTLDHVVPRSRGGASTWENLVACCHPCNRRKGNQMPLEAGMKLMREPHAFNLHTSRHIMRLMGRSDDKWRKYLFY